MNPQSNSFPLKTADLPPPPHFRRLIGPSFVLLGLGLGSGEIILWPYLASKYGLGMVWAIVIGITIQFFLNLEVERYALVNGESIFVGFARWLKFLPVWFILSTFFGFGWPGIGLTGAQLISHAIAVPDIRYIGVAMFISIGLILSLGKKLYQTVETIQKFLILVGSPIILGLALYLSRGSDWTALGRGLVGQGSGFSFLPPGLSLATFLAALTYSGAGGNLNLAQSFYIRDKGYGMGAFADKIQSVFRNRQAASLPVSLSGTTFPQTADNISRFKIWWKLVNLEHFLVFWLLGVVTMVMLSLLAYVTAHGAAGSSANMNFLLTEAASIGNRTLPFMNTFFLLVTGFMLTATQLTVLDSTSRIITENLLLLQRKTSVLLSRTYYLVLWAQIAFGVSVILSGFAQPGELVILGAVINGFAMLVYSGLLFYLNSRFLPRSVRPSAFRVLIMLAVVAFLIFFCGATVLSYIN